MAWRPLSPGATKALGLLVGMGVWLSVVLRAEPFAAGPLSSGIDAHPYWSALSADPYAHSVVGTWNAYLYSPVFLQLLAPLRLLPWVGFMAVWTAILLGALYVIGGPKRFLWILLFFGWSEIVAGNISYLLALVLIAGFSRPALWSFTLLTKVTPGIGLVWFAARAEWRSLAIVALTTALVVAASMAVGGVGPWVDWVQTLLANNAVNIPTNFYLHVGREVRFPLALVLGIVAARTDRRVLMPLVVTLALPVIWWGSLSILFAIPALWEADRKARRSVRLDELVGRQSAPAMATVSDQAAPSVDPTMLELG